MNTNNDHDLQMMAAARQPNTVVEKAPQYPLPPERPKAAAEPEEPKPNAQMISPGLLGELQNRVQCLQLERDDLERKWQAMNEYNAELEKALREQPQRGRGLERRPAIQLPNGRRVPWEQVGFYQVSMPHIVFFSSTGYELGRWAVPHGSSTKDAEKVLAKVAEALDRQFEIVDLAEL